MRDQQSRSTHNNHQIGRSGPTLCPCSVIAFDVRIRCRPRRIVYLTARSYVLAGFTATSIVAAAAAAPIPAAHLPGIQSAHVRLLAADPQLTSNLRTFRTAEVRMLASLVDHAATVVEDLDVRSRAALRDGQAAPGVEVLAPNSSSSDAPIRAGDTNAHERDAAHRSTTATPTPALTPSNFNPLIADAAAFNLDLVGTPFALLSALTATGDVAISDLSNGLLQDLLPDVINTLEFNAGTPLAKLATDISLITDEINKIGDDGTVSTTQSAAGTATSETPTAAAPSHVNASAAPTGSFDPSVIGPLIGDTAILGLDLITLPSDAVVTLTDALSGAAHDLGAGQVEDAEKFVASTLRAGFNLAESRITTDLNAIRTHFAQLTGTSSPTNSDENSAARSSTTTTAADRDATPPASTRPQRSSTSGRIDVTKQPRSVNTARPVTAAPHHSAPNDPTSATSTSLNEAPAGPRHARREGFTSVSELARRGSGHTANTTATVKAPTKAADRGHQTTKRSDSSPKQHRATGGKHRKH
jgi:hypothetical protein